MNERKLRIAEFIETLERDKLSTSIVLGGAIKPADGTLATNGTDCKNDSDVCANSTNFAKCTNSVITCDSSSNGNGCLNTDIQPKPDNASCSTNLICR